MNFYFRMLGLWLRRFVLSSVFWAGVGMGLIYGTSYMVNNFGWTNLSDITAKYQFWQMSLFCLGISYFIVMHYIVFPYYVIVYRSCNHGSKTLDAMGVWLALTALFSAVFTAITLAVIYGLAYLLPFFDWNTFSDFVFQFKIGEVAVFWFGLFYFGVSHHYFVRMYLGHHTEYNY